MLRRDPDGFAREQAAVSTRYAAQVFADQARFAEMVRTLGPSLAIPAAPDDAPSSPARALFGSPLTS